MNPKSFDLNIEQILENWKVRHAVREIIANALDEQVLSNSADVEIFKRNHSWIVRDFGRGIRYTHFTQNENQEKLTSQKVIGRFGIGLKDALATFQRHNVKVEIESKYGIIHTKKSAKYGFGDITTLHALIEEPRNQKFQGTQFELIGVSDEEMSAAKELFLKFSTAQILETTKYGQIIRQTTGIGAIYISGVKVAEEENFLFSYNITQLNTAIKKAINRERSHVGRSAYTETIKKILLASENQEIAKLLSEDISKYQDGTMHDELAWIDVQEHAVRILNSDGKVMLVTAQEALNCVGLIDEARRRGLVITTIPENLKQKIGGRTDIHGNPMMDLSQFAEEFNESFNFDFIDPDQLSASEREVYDGISVVISFFGGLPGQVREIKVSNTMRPTLLEGDRTLGCWDPSTSSVVLHRKLFRSFREMAGTLIHELVHAKTGLGDVCRDFESALTSIIGLLCEGWKQAQLDHAKILKDTEILRSKNTSQQFSKLITPIHTVSSVTDSQSESPTVAHTTAEIISQRTVELDVLEVSLQKELANLSILKQEKAELSEKLQASENQSTKFETALESQSLHCKSLMLRIHELERELQVVRHLGKQQVSHKRSERPIKRWFEFWK